MISMADNKNLINYLGHAISFKGGEVADENLEFLVESYCSLWKEELLGSRRRRKVGG